MKIKNRKDEVKRSSSKLFIENRIGSEIDLLREIPNGEMLMSPKNAARYLDVSRKFIYELIQSKKIEAICLGRKLKRIKKRTLDEWLNLQAMKQER